MGGPPAHIRSLHVGKDRVRGRGASTGPVVAEDGGRCQTEGYSRRSFGKLRGVEVTVIWKAWKEGVGRRE